MNHDKSQIWKKKADKYHKHYKNPVEVIPYFY